MVAPAYLPVLILVCMGLLVAGLFTAAGYFLGPKRSSQAKDLPFESGLSSEGTGNKRYDVQFYMTALVFLVFDVEVVFLYPWAVQLKVLGWAGFLRDCSSFYPSFWA